MDRLLTHEGTMGRQEIVHHIESELDSETSKSQPGNQSNSTLCQQCGIPIEPESEPPSDYIIHRVPSNNEPKMNSVFYCGRSCFEDSMKNLFDT
jgi:hypothetical protein